VFAAFAPAPAKGTQSAGAASLAAGSTELQDLEEGPRPLVKDKAVQTVIK